MAQEPLQRADIEELDISDGTVSLNGNWELYWKHLILPDELSEELEPDAIVQPGAWHEYNINGSPISRIGFATYYKKIRVDTSLSKSLGMIIPPMNTAFRLYINGRLLESAGEPGASASGTSNEWVKKTVYFPVEQPTLEILIHISNFSHRLGGMVQAVKIGDSESIRQRDIQESTIDMFVGIALLVLSFFFISLYFFWSKRKAVLYFSLFAFFFFFRLMGGGNYLLYDIFPGASFVVQLRIEYISAFLSFFFAAGFVDQLFKKYSNAWIYYSSQSIVLIFTCCAIILPTYYLSFFIVPFIIQVCIYMVYIIYTTIRSYGNRDPGSGWMIMAITIQAVNIILYCFYYLGIIGDYDLIFNLLLSLFLFSMTVVFAKWFSIEYHSVETLSKLLEEKNTELVSLNNEKNDFVRMVAHDLKSPLNNILGLINILNLTGQNLSQEQRETLLMVSKSANRLRIMIPRILDTDAIESHVLRLEIQQLNIVEIVEDVVNEYLNRAKEKEITFHRNWYEKTIMADVDNELYSQIIENLLSNAIKYSPPKRSIYLNIYKEESEAIFTIEDEGPGFSENDMDKLFLKDQKLTAKPTAGEGSTGLGLSIVKKYADALGGEIKVINKPGEGAKFILAVPVANSETVS